MSRHALVVGVSGPGSVGWACAEALAAAGDTVTVTCRRHRLDAVRLAAEGAFAVRMLDVDEPDTVASLAELPRVDAVLHALVSVPPEVLKQPLTSLPRADFEGVLSRSAWSLPAVVGAVRTQLEASGTGRVVTLSSGLAASASDHYHVAGIAKAALEAAARYLAWELGPSGVAVQVVRFGLVDTPGARAALGDAVCEQTRSHMSRRAPQRAAVSAADVAAHVVWLTRPEARNATAQIFTVDAGFSLSYF
jgi:enoyl-[acyl-carrier protein] reductase I